LEFKQISNDTAKDVLFETENVKAKLDRKDPRREKLRGDKGAKEHQSKKSERRGIKAEGLSYKVGPSSSKNNNYELLITSETLLAGTLVLGCISQINQTDFSLSLANNSTCFVPLASI